MSHSRETEHYSLPLYDGTDIINPLTDFNNANEAIDEAIYDANQTSASASATAQQAAEQVGSYDSRITAVEQDVLDIGVKSDNTMKMIANEFDPLKSGGYKIGDVVIYNQHLYTFINNHSGAWDASDVKEQPIGDALEDTISQAKTDINEELEDALEQIDAQLVRVDDTQKMIAPKFDAAKVGGYAKGALVTYADKLYQFTADHVGAWSGADVAQVDVSELFIKTPAFVGTYEGGTQWNTILEDILDSVDFSKLTVNAKIVTKLPAWGSENIYHYSAKAGTEYYFTRSSMTTQPTQSVTYPNMHFTTLDIQTASGARTMKSQAANYITSGTSASVTCNLDENTTIGSNRTVVELYL